MTNMVFGLAAMLALLPAPASAQTMVTYTGTVGDVHATGTYENFFGAVGVGTPYSLTYTISPAAGAVTHPDSYSILLDGPQSVTAKMTINGLSQSVAGTHTSTALVQNGKPSSGYFVDYHREEAHDYVNTGTIYHDYSALSYLSSYATDFIHATSLDTSYSYAPTGGDSYYDYFYLNDFDFATNQSASIYLNLAPGLVTATVTPVPEPASWAMLLVGCGLTGAMVRRAGRRLAPRLA